MSDATSEALLRRLEDIHSSYQFNFAGKPRVTRRIEEMDELLRATAALLTEAERLVGSDAPVLSPIRERLEFYRAEHNNISAAQKTAPETRRATQLTGRANQFFAVYGRHFAGRNRTTRDVALLGDVIEALEEIQGELKELRAPDAKTVVESNLPVIEKNLQLYTSERDAILGARRESTPEERTGVFANIANSQFEVYRVHFADKPRLSRRPALLERIVATLEACFEAMTALAATGVEVDTNEKNAAIVTKRLDTYRLEVAAVRTARENASVFELIDALGQAANAISEEYVEGFAGKERSTREIDKLSDLIDRLIEVERQMWSLAKRYDNPVNERNNNIAQDSLIVYQREYDLIREVQNRSH